MPELTFITGNADKVALLKRYSSFPFQHHALDLPEIQSLDVEEVVAAKAQAAYEVLHQPVLVEDTSLTFHAFGRLPGPFIKWFLTELKPEGLFRLVEPYPDHTARAEVCYGLCTGDAVEFFRHHRLGLITPPRGRGGFGWNSIFQPDGSSHTYAEMDTENEAESYQFSLRAPALKKLEVYLKQGTEY